LAKTLTRGIYFYRAIPLRTPTGAPGPFKPAEAFKKLAALKFEDGTRYQKFPDGGSLCCWPDHGSAPQCGRLARIRHDDFPQVEVLGQLSPVPIPRNAGLAEQTHFVFFPNDIVGVEFNFYGPRPSRLASYFNEKTPDEMAFVLEPLLRGDIAQQLRSLTDVRLLSIRTHSAGAEVIKELDKDIGSALDALAKVKGAETIDLVLRPRSRNLRLDRGLLGFARKVFSSADARAQVDRLSLRGMSELSGKVEDVDVLSDFMVSKKQVLRQDTHTRAVQSKSTYSAIREAYVEFEELFEAAEPRPSDHD
jgi:hypothetical protein